LNLLAPLYRFGDRRRFRRHRDLGQYGEDLAHRYLRQRGFTLVARNWRPPQGGGEIDIIAREGQSLVFVEVKTRASGDWGDPERGVDREKMSAVRHAARDYMRRAGSDPLHVRFDAISITGSTVRHLRDAFPLVPSL
jgi:putative endonuclease